MFHTAVLYGFNPTLVRLRHRPWGWGYGKFSSFQSHAGSIEARIKDDGAQEVLYKRFNPTLVRLRLGPTWTSLTSPAVSIPRWFD